MTKRKSVRKKEAMDSEKGSASVKRPVGSIKRTGSVHPVGRSAGRSACHPNDGLVDDGLVPVPAVALKVLSIILSVILVIALVLYILGKMSSAGFWTLGGLLALIAFLVIPWIRRRYVRE